MKLLAIKFNHDSNSANEDALNLRRNATDFVDVPEWVRGMIKPEESLAAYSLRETKGHTIKIQVKFACATAGISSAYIRAVPPPPPPPPPPPSWWLQLLKRLLALFPVLWQVLAFLVGAGFGKNVLGEVKEKQVTFLASGETGYETFELKKDWLQQRGVGVHDVTWEWQYRVNTTNPWTSFAQSNHRIYTVLGVPQSPWQQKPYSKANTQLPWTEVLDYSCSAAAWAFTLKDAAAKITQAVNALGPNVLKYSGASHWYSGPGDFDCTAFLDLLNPNTSSNGNGHRVDCSDCATILSTFANILGCDLSQCQMNSWSKFESFKTNPILPIGLSGWAPTTWNYHEVAWTGGGGVNDHVFDASLHLNNNANPANKPYVPSLAADLRFGNPGDGDYRDKLASANPTGNRKKCYPDQHSRRRTVK